MCRTYLKIGLTSGLLLLASAAGTNGQLLLSKDTVYSIDVLDAPDTVSMRNLGTDTLTIDSIFVERDSAQMPDCVISVDLWPLRADLYYDDYTLTPRWPPYHVAYYYNLVTIPPGQSVEWNHWYLAAYVPRLTKAQANWGYTGDTLGALLTFYAGPYRDSLVVMGRGACEGCVGVRRHWKPVTAAPVAHRRGPLVDLRGKRVSQGAGLRPKGVYVDRAAGRACLLVE